MPKEKIIEFQGRYAETLNDDVKTLEWISGDAPLFRLFAEKLLPDDQYENFIRAAETGDENEMRAVMGTYESFRGSVADYAKQHPEWSKDLADKLASPWDADAMNDALGMLHSIQVHQNPSH